jgi:hypothetical protein
MDTKIFLQGFDSKVSSNTSEGLNVQFKGRKKLLPLNDVAEVISQYDQYTEERKNCNIIRLTCQVNPICSNVLFNKITEIVKNEGSSGVSFINYGVQSEDDNELFSGVTYKPKTMEFWGGNSLNYLAHTSHSYDSNGTIKDNINGSSTDYSNYDTLTPIGNHPTNAIRDTQLSNMTTNFVYHCGIDIFNNHLIRSNTFKTVCKLPNDDMVYDGFNTITDLMRDVKGNKVIEKVCFPVTAPVENHARLIALHLYAYDDIDIFKESRRKKLIKKYNGWLGFENKSKIKSYADFSGNTELEIERPIMYMSGGDFVDMYPGRDLYTFLPRYNKFRNRIEKNWNYCITYPSSSYTPSDSASPFSDIIESANGLNSLKTAYFNENTKADNGTTQLVMYSVAKHGLSKGDYVNIYKTYTTYKYWVVDKGNNRISDIYNTQEEADDELKRLKKEGKVSLDCGETEFVEASSVVSSTTVETFTEKILDNAEVNEIVDDYIFTVFNSTTQISKQWIKLTKGQLRGTEYLEIGNTDESKRRFKTDYSTRKFMREVTGESDALVNDTIYYIVNNEYVNVDITAQNISYKKVVGDIECDYYIRIFSKLPNFKFASGDTSSEYEIYRKQNDNVDMLNIGSGETMLSIYQDHKYEFESHVSRLAFAKNIYTDDIGEIVFTDDIDISNLHDNLGRPLTSIYMTFIKNNKGYKEWYGYDYDNSTKWDESEISGDTVEFSHAFGKITCGIETSYEANYGTNIDSIHRITNVSDTNTETPSGFIIDGILNNYANNEDEDKEDNIVHSSGTDRSYITESERTVLIDNNEVWYEMDKHFYGDLCYYDGYNAIERHIDYIMHRFNTAQRESVNSSSNEYFQHYVTDEIVRDDYDTSDEFKVESYENGYICNLFKEGYYYNPHYEIPIKTFDKLQTMVPDFLTIREMKKDEEKDNVYQFTTLEQHFLSVGDKAILYDSIQDKYYNLVAISGRNDNYRVFTCNVFDEKTDKLTDIDYLSGQNVSTIINDLSTERKINGVELYDYKLFKMDNLGCPSYAKVLKDGTCRVIWRNILNNGFNKSDDSVEEYPYTNGAFYINKRFDIYVRRQDPHDEYWLYSDDDVDGASVDIIQEDNYVKEADIEC